MTSTPTDWRVILLIHEQEWGLDRIKYMWHVLGDIEPYVWGETWFMFSGGNDMHFLMRSPMRWSPSFQPRSFGPNMYPTFVDYESAMSLIDPRRCLVKEVSVG